MGAVAVPPSTLGQAGSTLLSDMLRGPESGRATRFEAGEIAGAAAAANPGNLEHVRQGLLTMHTIMSVMDEPARVEERREEGEQQQEEEEEKEDGEEKESKTEEERQSAEVGHLYILVLPFKIIFIIIEIFLPQIIRQSAEYVDIMNKLYDSADILLE